MSYQVLARRWRPTTFEAVVGQPHITKAIENALERDRVAHAFLLTGIRGVGKTTVARLLARALNCKERRGPEPCNECGPCTQALKGASIDIIEIDGASNRGIDEVRDIIEAALYLPAASPFKVYIIDEVHQLTGPAFNALLKLLEEPPDHVKFIMATTEAHKLPATVLSRCQRHDFRRISVEEIGAQLDAIVAADGLEVAADVLALVSREADGSMRDAQSLLEQVLTLAGGQSDEVAAASMLGVARRETVRGCVEAVLGREPAKVIDMMAELRTAGVDLERFLSDLLGLLRYVALAAATKDGRLPDGLGQTDREVALAMRELRSPLDLQRIFGSLLDTAARLRGPMAPDLVLEMGLIKAASLDPVESVAEVLAALAGAAGKAAGPASSSGGGGGAAKQRVRPQASPAQAPQAEAAPTRAAEPAASDGTGDEEVSEWEPFLLMVRERMGVQAYVNVSNCELSRDDSGAVELRPLGAGFRRALDDKKVLTELAGLASEHFGATVEFRLCPGGPSGGNGVSIHGMEKARSAKVESETMEDPLVKEALDVFGGKVDSIVDLGDREKGR